MATPGVHGVWLLPQNGPVPVPSDHPICHANEDALGRSDVAASFARQVLSFDASNGMVVGVLGAWGSGKTSFVNLARDEFAAANVAVLDFNPWMFSGAEQLVESFFVELAAQLKVRPGLSKLADDLIDYGEAFSGLAWLPVVGPWVDRGRGAARILGKLLQRRREGVGGRRAKVEKALSGLERPVLVVLDDIDRLSTSEIRDVFKLVRLTASFPNVIYVLAFDRLRVELALAEQGISGRDYLEKILQVAIDLPVVPEEALSKQIFSAVAEATAGLDNLGPFDSEAWPDVFAEIVRPLVRNMRDVRRYAAAVHGTAAALDGQIALVDVLALEAVRVFLPDVFMRLGNSVEGLTTTASDYYGNQESPQLKTQIEQLIEVAGDRESVVRALIARRFPAAGRHIGMSSYGSSFERGWLRGRQAAHEAILRLYLERLAGADLQAFTHAEHAWAVMDDRSAFEARLRSVDADFREDVIRALETYEDEYREEHVVPASIVLLNQLPELPVRPRSMFDFGAGIVVSRVVLRLIRSLKQPDTIEAAVRAILPEVSTLSAKFELITDIGYRENAGHKLVTESAAAALEAEWRSELRSASLAKLMVEPDLLRVLAFALEQSKEDEPTLEIPADPEFSLALLRSAQTEVVGQTVGNRGVRRSARLHWGMLTKIYGDEATTMVRIRAIEAENVADENDAALLELADQYAAGWRPDEFGRRADDED